MIALVNEISEWMNLVQNVLIFTMWNTAVSALAVSHLHICEYKPVASVYLLMYFLVFNEI